eukprot:c19691_g1_i2 orf=2-226(-)
MIGRETLVFAVLGRRFCSFLGIFLVSHGVKELQPFVLLSNCLLSIWKLFIMQKCYSVLTVDFWGWMAAKESRHKH